MKTLLAVCAALLLCACESAPVAPENARATAQLQPTKGNKAFGEANFEQLGENRVRVSIYAQGLKAGAEHGLHIHEKGDCSAADATSAGGHFNPAQHKHGATPVTGHAGDLGNVIFDGSGKATVDTVVSGISVSPKAPNGIVGRAVVVHMSADDLTTDPTGNSGARVACGVIS